MWRIAVVFVLLLLLSLNALLVGAASASQPTMKVEHHRYLLAPAGLLGMEGACDDDGVGAVVFCETLQSDPKPDKFHVAIRDDVPIPMGGRWMFMNADGLVVHEGAFCKEQNEGPVPHNATRLVVRVEPVSAECGTTGTQGHVIVAWRWGSNPQPKKPVC